MPNIQSAIKKVRKDQKRKTANAHHKKTLKQTLKKMSTIKGKDKKTKDVAHAYAVIDKAAKRGLIHKNTAARLKSQTAR